MIEIGEVIGVKKYLGGLGDVEIEREREMGEFGALGGRILFEGFPSTVKLRAAEEPKKVRFERLGGDYTEVDDQGRPYHLVQYKRVLP